MSNTSTVTPYASTRTSTGLGVRTATEAGVAAAAIAAGAVAAAGTCAVSVARWLGQETEEDRKVLKRLKATRQREALGPARHDHVLSPSAAPRIQSQTLCLTNPQPLLDAAATLGYTQVSQTAPMSGRDRAPVLLENPTGERLAVGVGADGALCVHTAGDRRRISNLVHQHTVTQARAHFTLLGMHVRMARQPNGEVQILASEEASAAERAGNEVRTQVRVDGSLCVDVNGVRGERCRNMVASIAAAVGGEVTATELKDSYFDRTGEPTRTRERV